MKAAPFSIAEHGATLDALTGRPRDSAGSARAVPLNNQVRRALGPALAGLRLLAGDPIVRRQAADELAEHPLEGSEAVLRLALSRERDSSIRTALEISLAQIDLASDDRARRISALRTVERVRPVALKGDLDRLLALRDGHPNELDPGDSGAREVRAARHPDPYLVRDNSWRHGARPQSRSVLLIAALGLAITFGLMRVINMAHGELLMIGAYTTFVAQGLFEAQLATSC